MAIRDINLRNVAGDELCPSIELGSLISFGNRYSGFYYHKEYDISLADAKNIQNADKATAKTAQEFILYALFIRDSETDEEKSKSLITLYLQEHHDKSKVYPYLRRIFGQQGGPVISTLLATLPYDYLNLMQMTLGYYAGESEITGTNISHKTNTSKKNTVPEI